ncbi:Low photosystem II accumulation 3 [Klebsormidium nitens]|uniref:Low photosystem II accumulation 3 n=1 Tax=Klebsormidium nitens TaxID=105231 RepID=A0A1Y1IQ22_KLENI|nr:Low photosystem II accumulation 3 [Klebsormidium nitens]|eukprot:GAQ90856.1 Low photosystem II accumulation 3 [Klebsormidium nitens]
MPCQRGHSGIKIIRLGCARLCDTQQPALKVWGGSRCVVRASAGTDVDPKAGVAKYKPASFEVLISDAARAVKYGLDDGLKRMEVEFPPLPSSVSGYKGASDEFADANISLAIVMARKLKESTGRDAKLVFSDKVELKRAVRNFKTALATTSGLSLGTLEDAPGGASKGFWGAVTSALDLDFSDIDESVAALVRPPAEGELQIVLNCSTVELKGVEAYATAFCKDLPVILFNLELETLRSDLGLLGFPPKDLQYRFLSTFKPVFYIRQRDYSKSVNVAPFLINYSGALLRQYPGPWQVMLKQGDGTYVCVAEDAERFTLGQVKEELLISLGLNTEEEGSALQFLRRGYKTSTWWEDDSSLEESNDWRT